MNKYIPLAPSSVPDWEPATALDADWAPAPPSDEDLIRDRERLDAALALSIRKQDTYDYIIRVRQRAADRARRIFTRSLIFFLCAAAFSMLIGAAT